MVSCLSTNESPVSGVIWTNERAPVSPGMLDRVFRRGLVGRLLLGVRQQQHLAGPAQLLHETFLPPVVDSPVVLPRHGGAADEAVHDVGGDLLSSEILQSQHYSFV